MTNKHIKVSMEPEIIAKASPKFRKIDAKAVAGVTDTDIIERNVIAEYKCREGEDGELEGEESEEADV